MFSPARSLPARYQRLLLVPVFILVVYLIHRNYEEITWRAYDYTHPGRTFADEAPDKPPSQSDGRHPHYKAQTEESNLQIVDNFPLAAHANSPFGLPPVPSWNQPPSEHVLENTPLLIGFTRNWRLLQQTVVSYISAGWPPEDIYVVENTGTMNSNEKGRLSLQNPFYLDYHRLTKVLGVNVLTTPALLTFAQLQNFFLYIAIQRDWKTYFWGHMDVLVLSEEDYAQDSDEAYKSLYLRAVDDLRNVTSFDWETKTADWCPGWAIRFYAYDRLALVNREAFEDVGGWDEQIPFYGTDCDMYERLSMKGWNMFYTHVGQVFDIARTLDDLLVLYRRQPLEQASSQTSSEPPEEEDTNVEEQPQEDSVPKFTRSRADLADGFRTPLPSTNHPSLHWGPEDSQDSDSYRSLRSTALDFQVLKNHKDDERNTWQSRQTGGQGEPYYRDPDGFEIGIRLWTYFGRDTIMPEKWGHRGCDLRKAGLTSEDAWRVKHDKDFNGDGGGSKCSAENVIARAQA